MRIAWLMVCIIVALPSLGQSRPSIYFTYAGVGSQQDWLFPYDIAFSEDASLVYVYAYYFDENESNIEGTALIILDTNLNIINIKRFPFNTNQFLGGIITNNDGSIYLSGMARSTSGADDGYVAKIDTSGTVRFFRLLGSLKGTSQYIDDYGIKSLHFIDAGSGMPRLIACGSVSEDNNGNDHMALVSEIDMATGGINWFHISRPDPPVYTAPLSGHFITCLSIADVPAGSITGVWGWEKGDNEQNIIYWTIVDTNGAPNMAPIRIKPPAPFVYDLPGFLPVNVHWSGNLNAHVGIAIISDTTNLNYYDRLLVFSYDANLTTLWFSKTMQFFFPGFNTPAEITYFKSIEYENNIYVLLELNQQTVGQFYFIVKIDATTGDFVDIKGMFPTRKGSIYELSYPAFNIQQGKIYISGWANSSASFNQDKALVLLKMDTNLRFENDCNNGPFNIRVDTSSIALTMTTPLIATDTIMRSVYGVVSNDTVVPVDSNVRMEPPPIAKAYFNPNYICFNGDLYIYDSSLNSGSWHYSQHSCDQSQLVDSPITIKPSGDFEQIFASALSPQQCNPLDTLYMWLYAHDLNYYGTYPLPYWFDKTCVDSTLIAVPVYPQSLNAGFVYYFRGDTVFFSDTTMGATQWQWDFGDQHTDTKKNTYHIYQSPGTYQVCLTVNNPCASPVTVCDSIKITTSPVGVQIVSGSITNNQIEKMEVISRNGKIIQTTSNPPAKQFRIPDVCHISPCLIRLHLKDGSIRVIKIVYGR